MNYTLKTYEQEGEWHWQIIDDYEQQEVATNSKPFKTRHEARADGVEAFVDWQD